jgi:small subunit ribosomal protein S21
LFFIYGAPICGLVQAGTDLSEELLKKRGRTEVFAPPIGSHGAHRQARFQLSTLVRTAGAISVRQWPRRLGHRPHRRSIEEERRMQVLVRDNNVDQALKVLKKKMQREGVFREMKLRGHYEKPSERRVREKAEAIRRARKLARKKLQREGLLPMKPRTIPGALGRGGPARAPRF